ncbi:MAG: ABC transporter ATP-binding protein [Chromatiales bacterium]|nr:ABC transporter ATP-binding protein [Chromatiales bacterium]
MKPLLSVRNLTIETIDPSAGGVLVDNISFNIAAGESFALLGESGSGKSLTALALLRLLPPNLRIVSGAIHLGDVNLLKLPAYQMRFYRTAKIAMVFQEPITSFNPVMKISKQILEPLALHRKLRGAMARSCALDLLKDVGLPDPERVFESYPHQLSGGMKQRAMIAMALAANPTLLIADEPTTALDVTTQAQVLELLNNLRKQRNMAMLFISHDLAIVSKIAERIAVMRRGSILEEADADAFFKKASSDYTRSLYSMLPDQSKRGYLLACEGQPQTRITATQLTDGKIEISDLTVNFEQRSGLLKQRKHTVKAVDRVSFTLKRGKTLALVGESGSGKTTIARALLALNRPTSGSIRIVSNNGDAETVADIRAQTQIVFQDPFYSLNPKMSVAQILGEALECRGCNNLDDELKALLQQVALPADYVRRYPHQLSGGQRQRICIARSLATNPQFIIWDEPTSALDVLVQAQILNLLQNLQVQLSLGYLFITHDISIVAYLAHEVLVIYKGKIVEYGDTMKVLSNPSHPYTKELLAAVPTIPAA